MAEVVLFNGVVPSSFAPTKYTAIVARRIVVRLTITVRTSPTTLRCYLEYGGDGTHWFRELAEEDGGDGAVKMPAVVRTITGPDGDDLPVGTTTVDLQFLRDEQLFRLQLACAGSASVKVTTPYGDTAY